MSINSRELFLKSFFTSGGMLDQKISSGVADEDLALEYGVSPETVRNWFLRTGFRRRPRARLSKLNMARIVSLSEQGVSADEIVDNAFSRSISLEMVQRALDTMSLSDANQEIERNSKKFAPKLTGRRRKKEVKDPSARHKRRSHWTPQQKEQVIELLNAGVEPYEVWRVTGASKRRQRRIAREFGVSI